MSFNGNEGETITLTEGSELTAKYRAVDPNTTKAAFMGRNLLEQILAQPDCMGIRVYYGAYNDGTNTLVFVGADKNGNDMLDIIANKGSLCPQVCGSKNGLNS
jgi:hypothetical protein